jgi:UDP-3-O-[3-hydroxymyristoyl] glucosamine N-acyltransferase
MGSKLDNQIQIAHNVILGKFVVMAGCCAVGGSAKIGDGCLIGGDVGIRDGIELGPGCMIAARTLVMKDWPAGSILMGIPATRRLPQLADRIKALEEAARRAPALEK